ncbi:T9SS type A sorting domain-containing protein [Candidatus Poribacteria bacterium]|nr:T9SS type A sorting domain-containing protein [Candidatus Poribacteria bacterium]MYI94702.1 T9SS type A sorting domain-containing protein [Candidatus Poribacteria bacterium]
MVIVKSKFSPVFILSFCLILFLVIPVVTSAQTANNQNNANQNTILSFSLEGTPIHVGATFTVHLNVENITDLAGWQCDVEYDPAVLEADEVIISDFLDVGDALSFSLPAVIDNVTGRITNINAVRTALGGTSGTGSLFSITFTAKTVGDSRITLSNLQAGTHELKTIPLNIPEIIISVVETPVDEENDNGQTLSLSTDINSINVGDTFTLHLNAHQFVDLSDWECELLFDPNILEASEVLEGDFLKEGDVSTRFRNSRINNTAGEITGLSVTRLAEKGVKGSGRLLSVVFTAKASGQARVTLKDLYAYSSNSEEIMLDIPELIVTVTELNSALLSCSIDEVPVRVLDTFTLKLNVEDATDFAGWFSDIVFDPAALEAIEVKEGEFLKEGNTETYFLKGTIDNTVGEIKNVGSIRLKRGGVNGTGTLLSVTFTAKTAGDTHIRFVNHHAGTSNLQIIRLNSSACVITVEERVFLTWDVNQDGQVNILDLMHVSQFLGKDASFSPESDVDSDGIIGILDLIVIAQHIGDTDGSAPSLNANRDVRIETTEPVPAMIQSWISQAMLQNDGSTVYREGIANLQKLLTSLIPKKTMLLHNYPNPFNPETWIPYQLSEAADVSVTIYAANGRIVRTLVIGHQEAGEYKSRSRAAYWDGINSSGEPVASGIYFYTLKDGDFTATRKMLIRK